MMGPGPGRPGTPRRLRIAARRITAAPAKPASVCGLLRIEDNGPAAGPLRPGRSVSGRAAGGGPATRQCRDNAGVGDGACVFSCRRCRSAVYRSAAPQTLKKRHRGRDAAAGHRQGAAGPWGRAVNLRREGAEGRPGQRRGWWCRWGGAAGLGRSPAPPENRHGGFDVLVGEAPPMDGALAPKALLDNAISESET